MNLSRTCFVMIRRPWVRLLHLFVRPYVHPFVRLKSLRAAGSKQLMCVRLKGALDWHTNHVFCICEFYFSVDRFLSEVGNIEIFRGNVKFIENQFLLDCFLECAFLLILQDWECVDFLSTTRFHEWTECWGNVGPTYFVRFQCRCTYDESGHGQLAEESLSGHVLMYLSVAFINHYPLQAGANKLFGKQLLRCASPTSITSSLLSCSYHYSSHLMVRRKKRGNPRRTIELMKQIPLTTHLKERSTAGLLDQNWIPQGNLLAIIAEEIPLTPLF